jgi:hypothetical protein
MSATFVIGNLYGHGFNRKQLSKLEKFGFSVRPEQSEYMGSQICHFIDFAEGPPLELIEVSREKEYLEFVPKGMKPFCPGISLIIAEDSESTIEGYEQNFNHLHPYKLHVNYDGSTAPRKPGWNYLNFETPIVPGTFIWLTKLDEPKPTRHKMTFHLNGVKGLSGIVLNLPSEELETLAQVVNNPIVDGSIDINGIRVWSRNASDYLPEKGGKLFPLQAVVLKTEQAGFDYLSQIDGAKLTSFQSQPVIHLETNMLSWDILVVLPTTK